MFLRCQVRCLLLHLELHCGAFSKDETLLAIAVCNKGKSSITLAYNGNCIAEMLKVAHQVVPKLLLSHVGVHKVYAARQITPMACLCEIVATATARMTRPMTNSGTRRTSRRMWLCMTRLLCHNRQSKARSHSCNWRRGRAARLNDDGAATGVYDEADHAAFNGDGAGLAFAGADIEAFGGGQSRFVSLAVAQRQNANLAEGDDFCFAAGLGNSR